MEFHPPAVRSAPLTASPRRQVFRARGEAGFSLLEVLVAVVVLSFGVLGVVGLQAASLQANKQAKYQSAAVRLGRELGDMMRGNKGISMLSSSSANPYLVANFTGTSVALAPENCFTTTCTTPYTIAQFEMSDWLKRVSIELPGARVVVCSDDTPYDANGLPQWGCNPNTSGVLAIKIGWTRDTFNHGASGSGIDQATRPGVVLPLIPA